MANENEEGWSVPIVGVSLGVADMQSVAHTTRSPDETVPYSVTVLDSIAPAVVGLMDEMTVDEVLELIGAGVVASAHY